jgi:signal transduction histidine kinase
LLTRLLLQRNQFAPAVWAYAMGLYVASAILIAGGDAQAAQIVPFIFPVIIFVIGLMLPPANTVLMAVLSALLVLIVPAITLAGQPFFSAHIIFAILLMFMSALLSAQSTGELYQITEWALMNYQRERRTNDELFEKRQELQRSLKRSEALSDKLKETNAQLEIANAAAEEAKHFRGQFLANMSHELRTPLNAIIGFSETMLKFPMMYDNTSLPSSYNNDMSQIFSSGRQLLHVINDILDLAKVDAGKLEVHPTRVEPEPIVLATISTAKGLIGGKPIELRKEIPSPMPAVWADETRLRQVLLNLYSNAAKFTDKGSITLTVREDEEGMQFSLKDTGCGIDPANLELIFEEFKQANTQGRDPRAGAGLGLSISRQLLTLMGGRIWVESKPGEGSTFHFVVPLYKNQEGTNPLKPKTGALSPERAATASQPT